MVNIVVFKNLQWWLEEDYEVLYSGKSEDINELISKYGEPADIDIEKYGIVLEKIDGRYADYDYFCEEVSELLHAIREEIF